MITTLISAKPMAISVKVRAEGTWNGPVPFCPAHTRKMMSNGTCTSTPPTVLIPTAVTAVVVSTPSRCMYRTFTAYPPADAGVMRLAADDASWARNVGDGGSVPGTLPRKLTVAPTYVNAEQRSTTANHALFAEPTCSTAELRSASCGYS